MPDHVTQRPGPGPDWGRWVLAAGLALLAASLWRAWGLMEADPLPPELSGTALGDAIAFAHSARIKYLHGVWFRPDLDDWRPYFVSPLHSMLVWLGFKVRGLTLSGLGLFPFIMVSLTKLLICLWVWWERHDWRWLALCLGLVTLYPPLNELSRIGTMDPVQVGLMALTITALLGAGRWPGWPGTLAHGAAGALAALTIVYKQSSLLWPLLPLVYLYLARPRAQETPLAQALPAAHARLLAQLRPWLLWLPWVVLVVNSLAYSRPWFDRVSLLVWPLGLVLYYALQLSLELRARLAAQGRGRGLLWAWLGLLALAGAFLTLAGAKAPAPTAVALRNLLPVLFLAYFPLRLWFGQGWRSLSLGRPAALAAVLAGLGLVTALYLVFWVRPHLGDTIYFAWRMFGEGAKLLLPSASQLVLTHLLDMFNSPAFPLSVQSFHALWLYGCLALAMAFSLLELREDDQTGLLVRALLGLYLLQCIFYDMLWHRFYGLLPLGVYALVKLAWLAAGWQRLKLAPRTTFWRAAVFGFCFYLMVTRFIHPLAWRQAGQHLPLVLGLLLAGMALHWLLLRRHWALALPALALGGLCLLPASLGQAYHYWHDPQPHTVRDISRALGLAVGEARVFGPYEYSLYNRTENCYVGNWRGQAKPDGFTWEGRKVDSLLKVVEQQKATSGKARFYALLERFYPGFLERWQLPPDYATRYHSHWLLSPPGRPSPRYLLIGADEDPAYITPDYLAYLESLGPSPYRAVGQPLVISQEAPGGGPKPDGWSLTLLRLERKP